MSSNAAEIATRWFLEVWNERAVHLIPELMSEDAIGHLEGGQVVRGHGDFRAFQSAILDLLPDMKVEVLRCIADGEDTCVLWEASGNHTGSGLGFAPTQRTVQFRGTTWFRVVDGRIVEGWDSWNQGGLFATMASGPIANEGTAETL